MIRKKEKEMKFLSHVLRNFIEEGIVGVKIVEFVHS